MWHVIGNSWGVGQDGVGGLGLGPQEHFRWKMVLMRRTMVTVNKNVKGEIQKHHLYADTEILDWNTEASLRGCGTPNTKSPGLARTSQSVGRWSSCPPCPRPPYHPSQVKSSVTLWSFFCRILKAKYWSHKVRLPTITTSINKTPNHSSPPGRLVPSPWQFSRPRWFFLLLLDLTPIFSRRRSNLCGCWSLGWGQLHGRLVRFNITKLVLKIFQGSLAPHKISQKIEKHRKMW